jgi:hypothetical protein
LAEAFGALPENITSLDLSYNHFGFSHLGAQEDEMTTLHFSCDFFSLKRAPELIQIFSAVPRSLTTLIIKGNNLGRYSCDDLRLFIQSMPSAVRFKIDGKIALSRALPVLYSLTLNSAEVGDSACVHVLGNTALLHMVLSFLEPAAQHTITAYKNLLFSKDPAYVSRVSKITAMRLT